MGVGGCVGCGVCVWVCGCGMWVGVWVCGVRVGCESGVWSLRVRVRVWVGVGVCGLRVGGWFARVGCGVLWEWVRGGFGGGGGAAAAAA